MCVVWNLAIYDTLWTRIVCLHCQEHSLTNSTLNIMHLLSSQLAGDIKIFHKALCVNVSLEILELYDITIMHR